jgi:hypothetical protein
LLLVIRRPQAPVRPFRRRARLHGLSEALAGYAKIASSRSGSGVERSVR